MSRALALLLSGLAAVACERELRPFRTAASAKAALERNAWALGQGKTLFTWYNCNGCHGQGGGGMGPPLLDAEWRYGSRPEDVFATIAHGRPNGMPAFGGRVPEEQIWMLVAYVRSLSGQVPFDAAPGRSDAAHTLEPELLRERVPPEPGP